MTGERPIDRERLDSEIAKHQREVMLGIANAHLEQREIDLQTARSIAHILGRALGRSSALAAFGRTGEGDYEAMREEYLELYNEPTTPPMVKEWIDWLGTHIVATYADGSGRQFMNERLPPKLALNLVRTNLLVGDLEYMVHAPADLVAADYADLADRLHGWDLADRPELQAFLRLRDVNANDDALLDAFEEHYAGVFDTIDEALHTLVELDEWERELRAFGRERGIEEAVSIDLDVIEAKTRELYDFVDLKGRFYAFYR